MNTKCKFCNSEKVVKIGIRNGKQRYLCRDCKHRFLDNGNFVRMRTQRGVIVTALNLYFEGLSVRKTQRQIQNIFKVKVSQVAVYDWITKYSTLVKGFVDTLVAQLGKEWHADETAIKVNGKEKWFWEVIDRDTRFMVASLLSDRRSTVETIELFKQAKKRVLNKPEVIITDGLWSYKTGFNKSFYDHHQSVKLIQKAGIRGVRNNNLVERLHGTLKDRLKVARGMDEKDKTKTLLDGWFVYYNFLRPHSSLNGKTPAQAAGVDLHLQDSWEDLIGWATVHKTICEN